MLSYLHSFHAGNFADVLKHLISSEILNYLTQKDKPFFYLDTHSGSGGYSLQHRESQKTLEFKNGIGKLWQIQDPIPEIETYLGLVNRFDKDGKHQLYPGSPWFAQQILRDYDRAALYDLHPREFETLKNNFAGDRRIKTHQSDGFHACISQLPPKEKRGYILMDPPYEVKQDYQTAADTLIKAHKKFATGTYALWYPVVDRYRIKQLHKELADSGIRNIQVFELGIQKDQEKGMTSSGMLIINPPWTLKAKMEKALPWLVQQLAPDTGRHQILQLVDE